jgi:membrane-associated phospholipid phosphatase
MLEEKKISEIKEEPATSLSKLTDMLFRDITTFGGEIFYLLILVLTLALQKYSLFILLLWGNLIAIVVVIFTRTVYFKPRPNKQTYKNWLEKMDASSFPSLHAARIWFLALLFSWYFKYNIAPVTVLILLAIITSYSRIYLKKHDWIDLLGGILLAAILFYSAITFF